MLQPFGPTASMFVVLVSVSILTKDPYASRGAPARLVGSCIVPPRTACRRPARADPARARGGHMDACEKKAARHVGRFTLPAPIDERCVGMADGGARRT